MKLLILLLSIALAHAASLRDDCDGVTIQGVYHDKETLVSGLDRPFFLDADHNSNDLYFGYTTQTESSVPAKINLKTKELTHILGVKGGFAHAINHEGKEIFVGGSEGIYKFDERKNMTSFYGAAGKNIWKMYYRDALYFTTYPDEKLYVFKNGVYTLFEDLQHTTALNFIVDSDNMMYYSNDIGLYMQKEGTTDSYLIERLDERFRIRALALDSKDRLNVCQKDGVFLLQKEQLNLVKLFSIDDAFGLTFDRYGNYIYADATSIYRLTPNTYKRC